MASLRPETQRFFGTLLVGGGGSSGNVPPSTAELLFSPVLSGPNPCKFDPLSDLLPRPGIEIVNV